MPIAFSFSPSCFVLLMIAGVIPYCCSSLFTTTSRSLLTAASSFASWPKSTLIPTFFMRSTNGTSCVSIIYILYSDALLFSHLLCAMYRLYVATQSCPLYSSIKSANSGKALNSTSACSHNRSLRSADFLRASTLSANNCSLFSSHHFSIVSSAILPFTFISRQHLSSDNSLYSFIYA